MDREYTINLTNGSINIHFGLQIHCFLEKYFFKCNLPEITNSNKILSYIRCHALPNIAGKGDAQLENGCI
jgi:hypothetical protein